MKSLVSVIEPNHTTNEVLIEKTIATAGPMISVLIPAHNEEVSIEKVIHRAQKTLMELGHPYEIIVVDDGSTDETCNAAYRKDVLILKNYRNCGKGHALQTGFSFCKGDIIVTMDADGSHQPEELPYLINPLLKNECDVVIGSRFKGQVEAGAIKRTNFVGNVIFNIVFFLFSGEWLTDTQSGFRALRRDVLSSLNLTSARYEIESEMTAELLMKGFQIREVPTFCAKPKRPSGLRTFRDGYRILATILKTFLKRNGNGSRKR
jgi:glycosyltransferase involved in cell wall biosynthesis